MEKIIQNDSAMENLLKNPKPTYDVGFWEYVYEMELKRYLNLLEKKANRLKYLKSLDLFMFPEQKAMSINKQIHFLGEELNTLYGMKLFMDEMKNAYLDSSCKIYDVFYQKNLDLEVENLFLKEKLLNLKNEIKCTI